MIRNFERGSSGSTGAPSSGGTHPGGGGGGASKSHWLKAGPPT